MLWLHYKCCYQVQDLVSSDGDVQGCEDIDESRDYQYEPDLPPIPSSYRSLVLRSGVHVHQLPTHSFEPGITFQLIHDTLGDDETPSPHVDHQGRERPRTEHAMGSDLPDLVQGYAPSDRKG